MTKRNTPAKQMILEALTRAGSALSQDLLEEQLKGQVDRVTIYRVLAGFCEDGIAHRAVSDEGKSFYALCSRCKGERHNHAHAHFRCLTCRTVECLQQEVRIKLPDGYRVELVNYWLSGECSRCAG